MEDILSLYKRPLDPHFPVVCMDEGRKQQLETKRETIPMVAGKPSRHDYEYERNGVSNIFMYFEPMTGIRHAEVTQRHAKIDWAHSMKGMIDGHYAQAEKIIVVLDNLATHKPKAFYEAFEPREARRLLDRIELHYTPKHASWLNMAEIGLSLLGRACLARRIPDRAILCKEIAAWERQCNDKPAPVDWRFTSEDARIKLKRLYPIVRPSSEA